MLCYKRIGISEGIEINKTKKSKKCNIYQHQHFLDKGFKFPPDVCNGCLDVLMMSMNLSHIAVLNINSADYCVLLTELAKMKL